MNRALRSILISLVPLLLAGQEVPRSNEYTDATKDSFSTTHSTSGNQLNAPSDLSESQLRKGGSGVSKIHPEAWPGGVAFVEAKSLPIDLGVPVYDRDDPWTPNGRRVFAFLVQPGEKLEFNMKAEDSQVAMRAFVPHPPPILKWKLELMNANRPLRSRRSKHFEIKNPTSEPQMLGLILYGVSGNSYQIEMARTPGNKG